MMIQPTKIHLGVYGLCRRNNGILMIKKSRGPYEGLLDLPGGSIEPNESIEEALKREVAEETGLTVTKSQFTGVEEYFCNWESDGLLKAFHHIGLYYRVELTGDNIKTDADGLDSNGALWLDVDDIDLSKITPISRAIIKSFVS